MQRSLAASILACATGLALAQPQPPAGAQDHAGHHPAGAASAPAAPTSPATPAARPARAASAAQPRAAAPAPDGLARQMQAMRDMHGRMQAARTPAERQALMDEHLQLMRAGMDMVGRMGGAGSGGMGGGAPGQPGAGGQPGMDGMMGMHAAMERRMALMEQMMQMLVDREGALPRR